MNLRWPSIHTCHVARARGARPPAFIEMQPPTSPGKWVEGTSGFRVCSMCESLHPSEVYKALTTEGVTLALVGSIEQPARYAIRGLGGVYHFVTAHLGDFGYSPDALRELCRVLSKAQPDLMWEPDVDGVYWTPKSETKLAPLVGLSGLKRKLDPVAAPREVKDDPLQLDGWAKSMEAEVRAFKRNKRGG